MKRPVGLLMLLMAIPLVGCGKAPEPRVTGVVVNNGSALQFEEEQELSITFVALEPQNGMDQVSADFDPATGSFKVGGSGLDALPPGEYKIVLTWSNPNDEHPDLLQGVFREEATPLRCTVAATPVRDMVIDVGTRTVSQQP
jgi:hypothetical protein